MNSSVLFTVKSVAVLSWVLFAAGCDSELVIAKGRILKGGRALHEEEAPRGLLYVTFTPVGAGGGADQDGYAARSNHKLGTFEVRGPMKKGIPRGTYRISVEFLKGPGADTLGKFSRGRSPIVRDVQSSEEIVIDLDRPEG